MTGGDIPECRVVDLVYTQSGLDGHRALINTQKRRRQNEVHSPDRVGCSAGRASSCRTSIEVSTDGGGRERVTKRAPSASRCGSSSTTAWSGCVACGSALSGARRGEGTRRGNSPLAMVDLHASEFEIHDFALELEGLLEGI